MRLAFWAPNFLNAFLFTLWEERREKKQGSASEVTTTGVWGHSPFIWRFTHTATKLTLLDAEATGARRPHHQNRAESDQADKHEKARKTQPAAEKHFLQTQPSLPPSVTFCLAGALQIENSEETDQGKYECVATNSQGVRYSSPANLYVRGRAWTQNTREHAHAEHAKTTTQNNYN